VCSSDLDRRDHCQPVSGMAMISAIRYAVWIQLIASGEIFSAFWIVGNEVATTWMSRIAMNMPKHIRLKPNQVATRAFVVRQTVIARCASSSQLARGAHRGNACGSKPKRWELLSQ